jgi:2,5-diamino-6-(ribosylamino)-4(3H)-pyrimidinone 5'-phosphate reductase
MSADGKIALSSRRQTRISSEEDMKRVYELRHRCDAVLVGIGTVLSDDPKLTVKERYVSNPKQPLRIVLDSRGRIPGDAQILSPVADTLVVVTDGFFRNIDGAETVVCGGGKVNLHQLMEILDERGIGTLLVEGGETVIWSFLEQGLANEMYIYVGSLIIGGSSSPTPTGGKGAQNEKEMIPLTLRSTTRIGDGVLLQYEVGI